MLLAFRFYVFLLCIRITELCQPKKAEVTPEVPTPPKIPTPPEAQQEDSLCYACSNFLSQFQKSVPVKVEAVLNGTRDFARSYIPYYSNVGGYVDDFAIRTTRGFVELLCGTIHPRWLCTQFLMC
ncbi:unnamed protein product [Haemonchus placei]|uniref:Saposin B-type domain-containing protein n=1 Tax=Haemonchus placei TaxID=6290 RepID=A0A0N4X4T5_HAEPC|nr:unnamed protein product [Haemonchus placei]